MAFIKPKLISYKAPEGYVYDYKVLPEDGEHLYANQLFLTKFDSIDNYILVEDPYGSVDKD